MALASVLHLMWKLYRIFYSQESSFAASNMVPSHQNVCVVPRLAFLVLFSLVFLAEHVAVVSAHPDYLFDHQNVVCGYSTTDVDVDCICVGGVGKFYELQTETRAYCQGAGDPGWHLHSVFLCKGEYTVCSSPSYYSFATSYPFACMVDPTIDHGPVNELKTHDAESVTTAFAQHGYGSACETKDELRVRRRPSETKKRGRFFARLLYDVSLVLFEVILDRYLPSPPSLRGKSAATRAGQSGVIALLAIVTIILVSGNSSPDIRARATHKGRTNRRFLSSSRSVSLRFLVFFCLLLGNVGGHPVDVYKGEGRLMGVRCKRPGRKICLEMCDGRLYCQKRDGVCAKKCRPGWWNEVEGCCERKGMPLPRRYSNPTITVAEWKEAREVYSSALGSPQKILLPLTVVLLAATCIVIQ